MSVLVALPEETYPNSALDRFTPKPEFDLDNARAMMWLSQLAYETEDKCKASRILAKLGLEKPLVSTNKFLSGLVERKACFIVASRPGATFVMFAGTDPLKPQDLITDFELNPIPSAFHKGFAEAVDNVQRIIEDDIRSRGVEQPLFFTGHSMGGALALISAVRAREHGLRPTAVYTFGCPRAGGQDFFDSYAALGDHTYRLVHGEDIVARVPPGLGDIFRHVGRLLQCPQGEKFAGQPSASSAGNDPDVTLAHLAAAFGIVRNLPEIIDKLLLDPNPDPRVFDQMKALPDEVRDHVPASYFRALSMPLAPPP